MKELEHIINDADIIIAEMPTNIGTVVNLAPFILEITVVIIKNITTSTKPPKGASDTGKKRQNK